MSRYVYLLDPGHGGILDGKYQTKGKRSPFIPTHPEGTVVYEGIFNRIIVSLVKDMCIKNDIEVVNLVDTQEDVPLSQRVRKANLIHKENKRSIYISIHANAYGDGSSFNSARGVSTFYHTNSRNGKKLAKVMQENLVKETGLKDRGAIANKTWANFYVLRKTHMPAILTENGFMTNYREACLMLTEEFQQQVADAHFNTIMHFEKQGL